MRLHAGACLASVEDLGSVCAEISPLIGVPRRETCSWSPWVGSWRSGRRCLCPKRRRINSRGWVPCACCCSPWRPSQTCLSALHCCGDIYGPIEAVSISLALGRNPSRLALSMDVRGGRTDIGAHIPAEQCPELKVLDHRKF